MERDAFSSYNPILNFTFFICAIVLGMFFVHPVFLLCSCLMSFSYYLTIHKKKGLKFIFGLLPVFIALSAINPFFNTYGQTVIFTYFSGRPYTLEALYYGMALASMFISILCWFACYNSVMTSDKFLYIFGKFIPSISLILTMVLRLVPRFEQKIVQIANARKCVGKSAENGTNRQKAESGLALLSIVTSWALEGSIITADSMRSRGYGSGKRTNFAIYRFDIRDKIMIIVMTSLVFIVAICGAMGGVKATYTPDMYISPMSNIYSLVGAIAYILFLSIPTFLNLKEALIWHFLRSRI